MIDGHAHACGDLLRSEGIVRTLDAHGVDRVVLVPGEHESAKTYGLPDLARRFPAIEVANVTNAMTQVVTRVTRAARYVESDNEFVYGLTRACPDRVVQFYWVMLRHGFDEATVAARYREWGFKGLKVHQCWERFNVTAAAFSAFARFAADHDLPVFVHLRSAAQARALVEVAVAHPDATFIVGHLCGLERFIEAGPPPDNLYFDFSCPDLVSDLRLRRALEYVGPERLIMGSDSPYGRDNLARSIAKARRLGASQSDTDLMLGGNLQRLLQLT